MFLFQGGTLAAHAWRSDPEAIVWRGDRTLPEDQQGVKVLGTPLGSPEFVRARFLELSASHQRLVDKIPFVSDLQRAWLLFFFCAARDTAMRRWVETLLDVRMDDQAWNVGILPLSLGGLVLRSAVRGGSAAYWSSWADGLHMIRRRHALVTDVVRARNRLDVLGHHRAECANVGVLGRRGFALESAAASVCREASGRVSVNVAVRDLDICVPDRADERRLEVVADGLPLFHGAQIAVDTTLVSVLRRDGTPHPRCANEDGAALAQARRRKELRYPELAGQHGRTKLVVLASEVGGRWSEVCRQFLCQLASAKTRNEPKVLRSRAGQAWLHGWCSLLACSSARAFAKSLLERRGGIGADGSTPSTADVVWEARFGFPSA